MILSNSIETSRRKAVWGPKRILGLGLIVLALAPYAAAEGRHGRSADTKRPGAPSQKVNN
jgi:hypothetical protein